MRYLLSALVVSFTVGAAGCADLTRPNEITIIAEPPPAPKVAPKPALAAAAPAGDGDASAKPAAKAGGG